MYAKVFDHIRRKESVRKGNDYVHSEKNLTVL